MSEMTVKARFIWIGLCLLGLSLMMVPVSTADPNFFTSFYFIGGLVWAFLIAVFSAVRQWSCLPKRRWKK